MLRAAAKTQVQQGLRTYSSVVTKKKSGGGKLLALTGVAVAGAGGVVGYAYVDPAFRQQVESQVPQLKPVFEQILGDASLDKTQKELGDKVTQIKESILPSKKAADDDVPAPLVKLPPIEKKAAVNVDAVDVRKDVTPLPKPTPQQAKQLNKQLEDRLMSAIQSAESRVKVATDAKIRTIEAVNQHAAQLKQTVDDAHNADWEKVTVALQKAEGFSRGDGQAETDGRNYIDSLKKIIADGRTNPATAQNPLLLNANETANKLNHQLDELNGLVSKARQESQILCQYKDLIDRSRQQFALELKSILPNVDVHAKEQTLNEEELNALIAHAHLRVDQLRRQLADQQLREEQHIARAIEEQRKADEQLAKEQLDREVERVRQQQEIDVERQVMNSRSSMQTELESQLKRTTSAHAEHLEQVIRTQRQLFEIEHSQKVEEAILSEREAHSRHIGVAVSKLEGIEHALTERTALDAENRRAKQFWIACHNLIDTIKHGNRSSSDMEQRRVPLADSLATLQQVNPDDAFVKSIAAAFPKDVVSKGAYSEDDIKKRFDKVYSTGRSVARIDGSGETTLTQYAWSWVRSAFLVELPRNYSDRDAIDPASIDNIEVLSRAKWFVERGDFEKAIKLSHLLKGEPALLAQGWIEDARHHIESRLLAQMLVAHAAVSSIRSTY